MAKISINLLPTESTAETKVTHRRKLLQTASIVVLLLMFFLSSLVLSLRFLQSKNINQMDSLAKRQENKILSFKEKESILILLKDRLDQISKFTANPSQQKLMYDSIVKKLPQDILISSVVLDELGSLSISANANDADSLSNLLSVLTSDEAFKVVSGVNVENLTRGGDGIYRASIKVFARQPEKQTDETTDKK